MNHVDLTHLDNTRNHSESHNKRNKDKYRAYTSGRYKKPIRKSQQTE